MLAAMVSALLSAYGLIELVEYLGIPVLSFEEWLFPHPPMIGSILTGRMSPTTAALLLLSGAVVPMLFLRERGGERQKLFGDLAGCLGILSAVTGTVFVLSYLHGTPFLYGTLTIPMAATTALAFLFLGTGQLLAVGPDGFPSRLFAGSSTRARLLRAFVPTVVGVAVTIDLTHVYAQWTFFEGNAFMSGVSTMVLAGVAGALIARVALRVGGDMDRSEEVRRGMEDTLQKHFHFLQVILDAIPTPVFYKDARGFFLGCNKAYEEYIGLPRDRLVGKTVYDIAPKDLADMHRDADDALLRKGGSQVYETEMVPADGKRHDVIFSKATFPNPDESLGGLVGSIFDITDRKRAEEEIKVLAKFPSENPDPIIRISADGTLLYINESGSGQLSEWNLQVGKIAPPPLRDAVSRALNDGSRKTLDLEYGESAYSFSVSPVRDAGYANLYGRNITERKQSELVLKESEEKFRAIFEDSKDGIVLVDVDSKKFHMCNNTFCDMLQYAPDEIRQLGILDVHPEEDIPWIIEEFDGCARHEAEKKIDIPVRRKDGSIFWADIKSSPVTIYGKQFILGNFRDVSEHRRLLSLEKQMRTAQKMEAVGTLAGGIAHDFNNALTGIFGFGELLRMRMAGDEQALHDLDEILRCAERASTLTRQLLTFARRQIIEPVNLSLSTLVADLMKFVGKVVGEHIEVKTSLGKNVPTIHADRGQIEQVVMNLCLNSRDAMPEGGRLVVEAEDVYLDEEYVSQNPYMRTGRYALLTVSDTGVGMDEKTRERVFEPFFTTKGPDRGTGLGLSMVYGIVKQHNGFIHVYSEPGKGAAFKVYFPAIEAQPDAIPTIRREETVRGGTETILLAEDEEAIRVLAERILTGFGYTVRVARNGEEAIEIFRQHKEIVLAVLDVVMPRKGGKEAFEEMHKQNPRLKVIFMSGYSPNAIHDSYVLTAGMPFLQKPFGPTILARKIRDVLDAQ
ncbi:MAG: PAS domain S-box protein [Deltaproteobacteria bacterium]|nr:PAS domain S-box protein [Deltaproteobacteria bacterium]